MKIYSSIWQIINWQQGQWKMTFFGFSGFKIFTLICNIFFPLIATAAFMPYFIKELHKNDFVAKDYYKKIPIFQEKSFPFSMTRRKSIVSELSGQI